MSDLINRQAVKEWLAKWEGYIDADIIARMQYRIIDIPSAQPDWTEIMIQCDNCGHMIHAKREDCKVSAQPEQLTDKEQRIFLAAMGREERVCEEVDRNYVREPYEDSLMRVCKEIRRKVKGALWT